MPYLHELVYTVLSAAATNAGTAIYPDTGPDEPTAPFVVYTRTPSVPENVLSGSPPIENTHLQIDCYAMSKIGSLDLAGQVSTAMLAASTFKALVTNEHDVYESAVKLYRVLLEFSIWH